MVWFALVKRTNRFNELPWTILLFLKRAHFVMKGEKSPCCDLKAGGNNDTGQGSGGFASH